jgi:energy-coupling factor transporter ATP-binding protein EcfA2/RecA/RadA recombinase
MLDNTRLRAELTHIHRTLSVVAAHPRGKDLVDDLRRTVGGTTAALVWQSLFADCLRVAHSAVAADAVIGDHEIEALYELLFSAARHFASVMPASYGEFAAVDQESARTFLERYAADRGPFGRGAQLRWPGLTLCRRAAELGEPESLERYERMMIWLIDESCRIGGVTETDPRWRGRVDELAELRRTLARDAEVSPTDADLRVQAFLAPSRVFAAVQQASSVFDADPFDVESIHEDTRATFEQMVERATTPSQHSDLGRMVLVLGDSGAGKTHLLRGFRRYVHEYGRGFVSYAQLHSSADDYARYLLQHVVDSLARPYAGPSGERTGLHELASGLPRLVGEPLRSRIDRLVDDTWESTDSLAGYVNTLVDELLKQGDLASFDSDLLRVMLYALHPDQRTTSRVYKYLRCEDMNAHDRRWIGDVVPRTGKDEPHRMICSLARLAFVTQHAALVLMVDQAELAGFEASSGVVFRRAIDALYRVVSEVPSAIAVVACLSDLYEQVHAELTRSAIDRLEKDPPVERLQINRSYDEIEAIVARRLSWLFAEAGAVHRVEEPVYPIPEARLRGLANRRTRDVLEWCHQFQARCAAAGKIVDMEGDEGSAAAKPAPVGDADLDRIAAAWNDAMHAPGIEVPDDDEEILAVIAAAARACAEETGLSLTTPPRKNGVLRLELAGATQRSGLAIAVTNRGYQGGGFATQIEMLRRGAAKATPIAVRTLEFPRGPASDKVLSQLLKAGGRRAYVDASTLRALVAFQKFRPAFPSSRVTAWRRRDRPVSSLPGVAQIFELELLGAAPPAEVSTAEAPPPAEVRGAAPGPRGRAAAARSAAAARPSPAAGAASRSTSPPLRAGTSTSFQAEARTIELDSLLRHTGILGGPGSGKTTLALNLIEQALERGVAAVLVDRKGDLAGYAKPGWWQHTSDPERARRLADRIDVRLFTPGARRGRPLSLPVVPDLAHVPAHERDRMVQHAAQALAAMMRLGDASANTARRAILTQAIAVLAGRRAPGGLTELVALLEDRDDELVARVERYDERLFKRLVQDLETVRLGDAELFDPDAESLTAETLIGRNADGKVPLAIATTRALGDVERVQAWVAHLIACLGRHAMKAPSTELRAILMIEEADLFMPAGSARPPSKEPLQDLLKRGESGLGIVLSSQSPADFDYRSREQIHTWFLGRIADRRSIDRMKQLFESRPAVRGKLGTLEAERFVMLQEDGVFDLHRAPSLLRTEQLAEAELMSLAARGRDR